MIFPLLILTIGAILAGYLNWPYGKLDEFLGKSPSFIYGYQTAVIAAGGSAGEVNPEAFGQPAAEAHESPFTLMMLVGGLVAIAGILLARHFHLKNRAAADELAIKFAPITRVLDAKYWVDEVYQAYIVEPLRTLGKILYGIDQYIVDLLVSIIGFIPQAFGGMMKIFVQRGYLQGYAAVMLLGIAAILAFIFVKH
jgi:NADH-quinone oxidoreductase subunit L